MLHLLNNRDEETLNLLKAKKSAESHFRKIRLAYEGPKWPSKAKVKKTSSDEIKDEKKDGNDKQEGDNSDAKNKENNVEKKFKPTATKKEFVSNFIFVSFVVVRLTSNLLTFFVL